MKKHVIPILTGIYLFSSAQITYANSSQIRTNAQASATTTTAEKNDAINDTIVQVKSESVQNNVTIKTTVLSQEELKETAGVLPGSIIYRLERAIEALVLAITSSEEKQATLKAQYAVERAAEAALLTENVKTVVEEALNTQDGAISDNEGFYAAKQELKAARESGDVDAVISAEAKVVSAEANKNEMKALKDAAEKAKEEVKALFETTEKLIEKAAEYVEESDEKIAELSKQEVDDKEIEVDVKARNELKIVEEKAREELIKQYEKRIEDKKKAQEKLR